MSQIIEYFKKLLNEFRNGDGNTKGKILKMINRQINHKLDYNDANNQFKIKSFIRDNNLIKDINSPIEKYIKIYELYLEQVKRLLEDKLHVEMESYKKTKKEKYKAYYNSFKICECGGTYTTINKSHHLNTRMHKDYQNHCL